ncbi:MAG TPA: LOG family protein [bacterium]|nr:LOG family protein [bacterium]HPP02915.1 LOG family protein [bacterium]HXK95556.1 LOG family protein [bacterium]
MRSGRTADFLRFMKKELDQLKPFSKTIAVYGSSGIPQDSPAAERAARLGRLLARARFKICNGGYMGVMEACSRGANEAGGVVIGVTCDGFQNRTPNPFLTEIVRTPDLPERIAVLMRLADGYIVLDGNIGTLAELFVAWNVVATGWKKPILVVGEDLKKALYEMQKSTEIGEKQLALLNFVDTADEAVEFLKAYFQDP